MSRTASPRRSGVLCVLSSVFFLVDRLHVLPADVPQHRQQLAATAPTRPFPGLIRTTTSPKLRTMAAQPPPPPGQPVGAPTTAPFPTNPTAAPPRPPTTDAHAHLDAVARHLDGLLAAAHDLRHHAPHLPYPALLTRLQVVTARMAALAHAMPAAALKDFLVLPFATAATRPHAAHAPEWLRSRPGPPLADREREMVEREKERVKRVAEAVAGTARSAGGGEDLLGAPPAKRARRGLAAALATAAATTTDAPSAPMQPVAPRAAAADDQVVTMQAQLDLEIKHHDRLVNVTVDYIRGTESDSDGGADAENDDDDEDADGGGKGRASGLAGRARRDRNEPGEYLRRVRALYVDLPPTPIPTAGPGHESDAASDDGAVAARRRRGAARRRAVRAEMPPVELARRLDDVVRYMHVGPGPAVVAPPPMAMDPRRGGGSGVRAGYVMSPDGGAVIAPRRTVGEK
ncbi:hypothetical protein GGF31_003998 [Allomyces arbusculus]|nr:hypothetical protein GGF31_003998 [Allomyces arbusculus]